MVGKRVATAAALVLLTAVLTGCSDDAAKRSGSPADALVVEGLEAFGGGDAESAIAAFKDVLEDDPGNVLANYNLGYLAHQDGRVAEAVTYYAAALETQNDYAPALYNLALLTEETDLSVAVDLYRRAISAKPDDAASYLRLGNALTQLGQTDEGAKATARGRELEGGPPLGD